MNIPKDLKYSSDHEWVRVEGNVAFVGITDFAQSQLGDIVFADLPAEGRVIKANEVFSVVESVKAVSDIITPVSGKIVQVNPALDGAPELINQDPYGEGWIVAVELADKSELDGLMDDAAYAKVAAEGGH